MLEALVTRCDNRAEPTYARVWYQPHNATHHSPDGKQSFPLIFHRVRPSDSALPPMLESRLSSLKRIYQGKVHDIYAIDDKQMLILSPPTA